MRTQTIETLELEGVTKAELFAAVRDIFDYALPHDWLSEFSGWCQNHRPQVTYDVISSTTVWVYPPGYIFGRPLTACAEVQSALDDWSK
jgi:hypothetical protein